MIPLLIFRSLWTNFAQTPALEAVLIKRWQGRTSDAPAVGRLSQVRALTRLYYAGVFFSAVAAKAGPVGEEDASAPWVQDICDGIRTGRIDRRSADVMSALGKLYLNAFMTGEVPPPVTVFADLEVANPN